MSFWAPFVLIHLGGQDTITAFSKQDNETSGRHLVNLVTQAVVAGYVVGQASWPDARLRAAVVLVFLSGCFKYAERIICLYLESPGALRWWSQLVLSTNLKWLPRDQGALLKTERGMQEEATIIVRNTLGLLEGGSGHQLFWNANIVLVPNIITADAPLNQTHHIVAAESGLLPVMHSCSRGFCPARAATMPTSKWKHFWGHCYRRLYTKDPLRELFIIPGSKIPLIIPAVVWSLFTCVHTSLALALFVAADKGGQLHASSRADIWVSYALLVGAVALDVASAAFFIFSHLANFNKPTWRKKEWSQEIGQYNIIKSAGMGFIKRWINWDVTCQPITKGHRSFILDTLLASGTRRQWNISSTRGWLALQEWMETNRCPGDSTWRTLNELEETVRSGIDFPTSVLIWHIATDICYYCGGTDSDRVLEHKQMSRELSQYVMYLVFRCGVMLTSNSEIVHDNTRKEISYLSQKDLGEKDVIMKLYEGNEKKQQDSRDEIQTEQNEESEGKRQDTDHEIQRERVQSPDIDSSSYYHPKEFQQSLSPPVLPCARAVAQELIGIKDEDDRWSLIASVWAEMLYYTATRCGGGFHYEHLTTGGEFATHVLVLMYLLGPFMPQAFMPQA